ncbi:unnamed protein product [Bursaphelenchus okinawaensis]|uniref:Lin-66-like winged helix domain-containing protein n=1 Tax=Bursaphelenchus okinawaensis TaxID=465554 RepID=A0A811KU13_9BILA|nr:unnamed protein product [Bursaphelenchus okinawaensis]CAG9113214.1 unnamed protein product [Bursaphelenchus okinawaensis]
MDPHLPMQMNPQQFNSPQIQPLMPGLGFQVSNKLVRGVGQLSWLSPKAGLITCHQMNATVSFQLKDFCDHGVTDLTTVLRPGFRLAFQAVADEGREWIGNYVSPCNEPDSPDSPELNLEDFESRSDSRAPTKDPYSHDFEVHALSFLLSIFQKNGLHNISLSSLHSRISNSGRDDLYRYIGSSSLKRRQFIERRSYIFHITESDVVFLQPAEIYTTVLLLAGFLLRHGGATSSDSLFNFFNSSTHIPQAVKDSVQNNRFKFMEFLSQHQFAFAPFPSQFYVAVRRNLPYFDYPLFINRNFPTCVFPPRGQAVTYTPGTIPNFGGFDQNAAAAADQLAITQFNSNNQMSYGGMFHSEDQSVNTPRNPWTNTENNSNPVGPSPAFGGSVDMGYGNTPIPKNLPGPGVIGGPMTRHNSVGSMGQGQYDMLRHGADLRVSCSPPISSLLGTIKPMIMNSETQTDEIYEPKPIGVDPACRCRCNCQASKRQDSFKNGKTQSPLKSNPASRQSSNGQSGVIAPPNSSGSTSSSNESGLGSMGDMVDPMVAHMLAAMTSSPEPISSVTSLSNAVASTASIWGQPKGNNNNNQNPCFGFPQLITFPPPSGPNNKKSQQNSNQGFYEPFSSKGLELKLTSLQL